jgi:hypothetical protein
VTIVWIVLCSITVGTWWLSPGHSAVAAVASTYVTAAVIALGFIKGRLIIRYFMEVRTAPRWLRLATDGWLLVLWTAVLGIYLV